MIKYQTESSIAQTWLSSSNRIVRLYTAEVGPIWAKLQSEKFHYGGRLFLLRYATQALPMSSRGVSLSLCVCVCVSCSYIRSNE